MNTSTTTHTQIPRHKHHATGYKVHIWSHQLYRLWKGSEPFLSAGNKVSLKSPISIHGEHIKSPFKISGAWTEIKIHIKLDWINKNPGLLKLYWSIQSLTRTTMIACSHEFPKPSTNFHLILSESQSLNVPFIHKTCFRFQQTYHIYAGAVYWSIPLQVSSYEPPSPRTFHERRKGHKIK